MSCRTNIYTDDVFSQFQNEAAGDAEALRQSRQEIYLQIMRELYESMIEYSLPSNKSR